MKRPNYDYWMIFCFLWRLLSHSFADCEMQRLACCLLPKVGRMDWFIFRCINYRWMILLYRKFKRIVNSPGLDPFGSNSMIYKCTALSCRRRWVRFPIRSRIFKRGKDFRTIWRTINTYLFRHKHRQFMKRSWKMTSVSASLIIYCSLQSFVQGTCCYRPGKFKYRSNNFWTKRKRN